MSRVSILDHGYIEMVESWGSDERIIEAARMSTGKGFTGWGPYPCSECMVAGRLDPYDHLFNSHERRVEAEHECKSCNGKGKTEGDEKLLRYLWEHHHTTPFEMAGATFEVQAPIFVFREWHRHRTQSYNEMSARYTPLPDVNYLPTVERCVLTGSSKQAQPLISPNTGEPATPHQITQSHGAWLVELDKLYAYAQFVYEDGLRRGIPKEIARLPVPVGRYSRMRASTDLWNWLHFLRLRMDVNAQWEIRQYANVVGSILDQLFPRTMVLFNAERGRG